MNRGVLLGLFVVFSGWCEFVGADEKAAPLSILRLPAEQLTAEGIDYAKLPVLQGTLSVVNPPALGPHSRPPNMVDMLDLRLNLHSYLIHFDGKLWCSWSDGPKVEDEPTQEVTFATSNDGKTWSKPQSITGTPDASDAYIARGLWVREGELLALAAHYRGKGAFGAPQEKQLRLEAFAWDRSTQTWKFRGRVYDNAINNFAPEQLASGEWITTRRDSQFNVSILLGGKTALDAWQNFPVVGIAQVAGFRPDEPILWPLDDNSLYALFRDNGGSRRLFQSTSQDGGRTWKSPQLTNFPNASSKLYSMKTSRGYRVLVLNACPQAGRRELYLAVSSDSRTFTRMAKLDIPGPDSVPKDVSRIEKKFAKGIAGLQYPHVIEHNGQLLVAFSRGKVEIDVFTVPLGDVDTLAK